MSFWHSWLSKDFEKYLRITAISTRMWKCPNRENEGSRRILAAGT